MRPLVKNDVCACEIGRNLEAKRTCFERDYESSRTVEEDTLLGILRYFCPELRREVFLRALKRKRELEVSVEVLIKLSVINVVVKRAIETS